jgi:hypothetical protein
VAYRAASVVVASAARTATGTSASQTPDIAEDLNLLVSVTAVAGVTPTLDLTVEWSDDGTVWAVAQPADSFTQIVATLAVVKAFAIKASGYRVKWTIGGTTPSFTFSIMEYLT